MRHKQPERQLQCLHLSKPGNRQELLKPGIICSKESRLYWKIGRYSSYRIQSLYHHSFLSLVGHNESTASHYTLKRFYDLVETTGSTSFLSETSDAQVGSLAVFDDGHNLASKSNLFHVEICLALVESPRKRQITPTVLFPNFSEYNISFLIDLNVSDPISLPVSEHKGDLLPSSTSGNREAYELSRWLHVEKLRNPVLLWLNLPRS
jgi:hypothetical protein